MKELSQPQIILKFLYDQWQFSNKRPDDGWIKGYELLRRETKWGWLGAATTRRLRELAEKGLIEHRIKDSKAEYRYKQKTLEEVKKESEQLLIKALF